MNCLIVGVNVYQNALIRAIREICAEGHSVTVIDSETNLLRLAHADISGLNTRIVDFSDLDRLAAEIKQEINPDCIFSLTEFSLIKTAILREKLQLAGNSHLVEEIVSNKFLSRQTLVERGLSQAKFALATINDLREKILEVQLPVVVKPKDLGGSIGVFSIMTEAEFGRIDEIVAFYRANSYLKDREFYIESFISGYEFSVEGIYHNSETAIYAITDKRTSGAPYFQETGHTVPSKLSEDAPKIKAYLDQVFAALGYGTSAFHIELFRTAEGVYEFVETHTRYAGGKIPDLLINSYKSKPYLDYVKALTTGAKPTPAQQAVELTSIEFIISGKGVITSIQDPKDFLEKHQLPARYRVFKKVGDEVTCANTAIERIGYLQFASASHEENEAMIAQIRQEMTVAVSEPRA